jgi:hypothetical protein
MLADLIINIIYGFALLILELFSLLGSVDIGGDFATAIDYTVSVLSSVNNILPVSTIIAILALDLLIELSIFGYKAIKWAYSKVPGIN